jgi:predicted enzyme related to lactoylglutathione lyase
MADLLQGRFVWYELMTTDTKAAEAFYGRVVGWTAEPFPGSDMGYTIWKAGDKWIGGLMALPADAKAKGAPPSWMIYVAVHDADAIAAQAQALGGRVVVPPTDIPKVGRFAVLADPQGAHIAVLRPDGPSPTGPETDPVRLEISWRELATTDSDTALSFYSSLFGWDKLKDNDMGPLGIYREFGRFGRPLGGMYKKPAEMPFPPNWLVYAKVTDIHASAAAVKALGGTILHGPTEIPGGDLILQFLDPQGAAFALHQTKA